jgi:formylglycine-generating enzyme required for sulfatase activity
MTKIYTINTLEVYANSQHIDAKVGEPLSLVVDIKINWVDQSSAQRILFYQWEQSLDRGVSWTQILSDKNVSMFDDRSSNTIYTNSYLVNGEFDFKWANFNIFSNQSPKAYLDTTRVVAAQNQARYRCNVFLYNVDFNIIESVATSDTMTLYVVDANNNPIKDTDILWDGIPNKRPSKDTILDQNTVIKLFNPNGVTNNVDILLNGIKIISNAVLPTSSGNALSINLGNYVDSFDPSNITTDTNLGQINAGLNSLTIQQSQKTTTFSVNPRSSWQSTGLSVTNGMKLVISAEGSVVWGGGGSVGPDGVYNSASLGLGGVSVDARFKHEALLGKVGSNIFLIGSYYVGTMSSAGTLEVATNDTARSDNSGSFDMTISSSTIKTTPISVLAVKSDGALADLSTTQKGVASTLDANGNLVSNTINPPTIVNSDPFTATGGMALLFNFKPAPPASPTPTPTITPTITPTSVTPTPTVSPGTSSTPTPTITTSVTRTLTPTITPTITTSPTNNNNPGVNSANWTSNSNWDGTDVLNPSGNVTSVGTNGGPSAYGTYDMSGNAREWVGDLSPWFTVDSNINRTIMGTSFQSVTACSFRDKTSDYVDAQSYYSNSLSFRVMTIDNPYSYNNFVTVSDINNNPDTEYYSSSYQIGSVSYVYKIGKYKVTNTEYVAFLNSIAATDTNSVYLSEMSAVRGGINRSGSSGSYSYSVKNNYGNKPVNNLTWFSALRYCNWLHNNKPTGAQSPSTTEDGAYTIVAIDPEDPQLPAANSGAKYRLPRTTEWWKAAYYAGGGTSSAYWDYATQSDNTPSGAGCNEFGVGPV